MVFHGMYDLVWSCLAQYSLMQMYFLVRSQMVLFGYVYGLVWPYTAMHNFCDCLELSYFLGHLSL